MFFENSDALVQVHTVLKRNDNIPFVIELLNSSIYCTFV